MSRVMVLADEADRKKFREVAAMYFRRFNAQRADIDESYQLGDWMYRGGTSRGEFNRERRRWIPKLREARSNVGSLLFFRQVQTLAGSLGAILLSGRELWRYVDRPTPGSPETGETGSVQANHMNAIARWVWKADNLNQKLAEFCVSVFKDSNVFACIGVERSEREVWVREYRPDGTPVVRGRRKMSVMYPTLIFPHPANVYADKYLPDIQSQECVIVLSQTTMAKLMEEARWFDENALAQIDPEAMSWDRRYGYEQTDRSGAPSSGMVSMTSEGTLLRWDVYMRVPYKHHEPVWERPKDDKNQSSWVDEFRLLWAVFVGNDLDTAIMLRCTDQFDPDGEIPIKEIRVSPDNPDMLYHTFLSDVLRPMYSVDCALMNMALDHTALAADPPMTALTSALLNMDPDKGLQPGRVYWTVSHDAFRPVPIPQSQLPAMAMREQIREDIKLALATDPSRLGEYAGARTTAAEVLRVTAATDAALAIRNAYIVNQLLPWMAKKYLSYCRTFMDLDAMTAILNEQYVQPPTSNHWGEMEIVVDIVGQYENDMERRIAIDRVMQILSNPMLLRSSTHEIDVGELVRYYLESLGAPVSRIVKPPTGFNESEKLARERVNTMLLTGVYVPPQPDDDLDVHLRVATIERMRWSGLEASGDVRASRLPLLERYIADIKSIRAAQKAGQAIALQAMMQAIPSEGQALREAVSGPTQAVLGEAIGTPMSGAVGPVIP